jgi:hypothetical protein
MSALRSSVDLLNLKTRNIVIQNPDGSYPPPSALLAMDGVGRGGTAWTQDISLNSVTLFGNESVGVLTYSDVSGLLLNSAPLQILPATVPFDSVADAAPLSALIQSYNELLAVLNGSFITVNLPPSVTGLVATPTVSTADLSWNSVGSGYTYTVDLCGSPLITDVSGTTYTITSLTAATPYTASVTAHNNSVFSGLPTSVAFTTQSLPPAVTGLQIGQIDVSAATLSWNSAGSYTYNIYLDGSPVALGVSGLSYAFTGLTVSTGYTASVRVTDGVYEGPPSSVSFTTATPLTVTVSAITTNGATISWNSAGAGYLYLLKILIGSTPIQTYADLSGLTYAVTGLTGGATYIASVSFTSTGFVSDPYTSPFTTTVDGFGFSEFSFVPGNYLLTNNTSSIDPFSAGYNVVLSSPWIGNQFNTVTLRMKSDLGSQVQVYVYNSADLNGSILASSGYITVDTEQNYVIPLSATVTVAYPMLIQFICVGANDLEFAVFTTGGTTPLNTMQPIVITNSGGILISPFTLSFAPNTGGFPCQFTLV